MFELKYAVTDDDIKSTGKALNLKFVIMYLCVALAGIGAGIAAIAVNAKTYMFVMGIILCVFGGLLLILAILLAVAPKTALESVVVTGENELTVTVSHENITVIGDDENKSVLLYENMTAVKKCKNNILCYFGKTSALLIKPVAGNMQELYEYIEKRQGRRLPPS